MNKAPRSDPAANPTHHPLYDTLHQLWRQFLSEPQWVPLDRWLAVRLRALPKLNQRQKLWLGRQLQDACRLALCVVYCERLLDHCAHDRNRNLETALPELAARLAQEMNDPAAIKSALSGMRAEDFFFWLRLRRSGIGLGDPGADPMPTPRHRSIRARRIWPEISRHCTACRDPLVRLLWHGLPPGIAPALAERVRRSGWQTEELDLFLTRHLQPAPTWLRINRLEQMPQLRQELLARGLTIHSEREQALQVSGSTGLFELAAYQNGLFEMQDLASQEIGRAVDIHPGFFVWDACAGFGGKSLQMAVLLQNKGALYASDIHQKKLDALRLRARRADLGNSLRTLPWPGYELPDFGREVALRNGFDRILVDAPCSGSGTLRRNPDGRLDFDPERITRLTRLQLQLLSVAAGALRPGGLLIYATCSLLCQENEDLVASFLEQDSRFRLRSQQLFGNPWQDSDTTFVAVMARQEPGS